MTTFAPHPTAPAEPEELGALTDDAIAGSYRIYQRQKGHRYSLDDVVTAWEAAQAMPGAQRCLELGSGVGSVLLMLAHRLPEAAFVAIEAQRNSFTLLGRNVARNDLGERVRLVHGDLRAEAGRGDATGPFDLVSGTPPYVPPGSATPSPDAQRAYARQEFRGGIEDYVAAGARVLASEGRMVVCGDARFPERAFEAARRAGLQVVRQRDVVPRAGSAPLFAVWTFAWPEAGREFVHEPAWLARDAQGARTAEYHAVRAFFAMAEPEGEAPSP